MTSSAGSSPVVEIYWRRGCPFCAALRRKLRRSGLPFREVNIWDDPAAAARVRSVAAGNETVPTVFIGARALVNPDIKQVLAVVATDAPDLLPAEQPRAGRRPRWLAWLSDRFH